MTRAPRKSAVAIPLARGPAGELLTLVGRRSAKSRFLGGFYAFPGGAWEAADGDVEGEGEDVSLRRTAVRELREETGIAIDPGALLAAGRRVTPPFSPRRFDSLMYVVSLPGPVPPSPEHFELEDLRWVTPEEIYARWRRLELRVAPPLIPILETLAGVAGAGDPEIANRLRRVNREMEADGPRIEFVPDVLMIPLRTGTLPPATHTNCYLVGAGEFVIVDPGSADQDECERLLRHVRRRASADRTPVAVLLTHHHGDHTGGAVRIAAELEIPVRAHSETWARWGEAVPAGRAEELRDGEVLRLSGGAGLRALHTPGHAAGHLAFLDEEGGSLFAGDLVSGVSTILVDSAPGSLDRYLRSLERIRDCGARTLFPAHGPPLISPADGVQALLDHRRLRESKIVAALETGPKAVVEIARIAYRDTPGADPALAVSQASSHLDRLVEHGRVGTEGDLWYLLPEA